MPHVNIHAAKTNLSRLVEKAAQGESFVIAKAGKPMVTVSPYKAPEKPQKRVGFLKDFITASDDFDHIAEEEIAALFEGSP
ncbi:MAG: type II toxin-antitoxin system prevent-host-death family antitoxin [Treponema sp.]|jgi:prevent-host-death family protein|nr:type II toxin-antitoxin system prevent-host-death family antitoxin [Treponema sp.]